MFSAKRENILTLNDFLFSVELTYFEERLYCPYIESQ